MGRPDKPGDDGIGCVFGTVFGVGIWVECVTHLESLLITTL